MKLRLIILAMLTASFGMTTRADVTATIDESKLVNGSVNVFELDQSTYVFGSGWGVADLSATFTNSGTRVTMVPNSVNDPDPFWYTPSGMPGAQGNKWMETFLYAEETDTLGGQILTFQCTVVSNSLTTAHKAFAFIRDFAPDYSSFVETRTELIGTGDFTATAPILAGPGRHVQYGIYMQGENVWVTDLAPFGAVVVDALYPEDNIAPTPDPMTFSALPTALGDSSIGMTATTATDNFFDVEYYFTCTEGAGNDSGWQSDTNYVDTGLDPGQNYTYTVMARDTSPSNNVTAASAPASAMTSGADGTPPSPNPMTFVDADASSLSVKLVATTATDVSPVEYYFTCVSGGGSDSGWQSSTTYIDTSVLPGSNYEYTVTARDISAAMNTTAPSDPVLVTTLNTPEAGLSFANSFQTYTGNTDNVSTAFELEKAGLITGSTNPDGTIDFDASGAIFGDGIGFSGRNVLKTISDGYEKVSFEAYATLTFSGSSDLSGFIGMGQGLVTGVPDNYGVPELNLGGVNGVTAQFKDLTAGSGIFNCNLFKFVSGNPAENGGEELLSPPIGSTETIRAKLKYDAVAETVNISIDKNYTGGPFVMDQDLGTVTTTLTDTNLVEYSMWTNAPVRVYVGGGEGTIVKDFEVVVTGVPLTTFDLEIADTVPGGGLVFTWVGAAGQVYNAEYKTDLTSVDWTIDTTVGDVLDVGGTMYATSTVGVAEAFYRFIIKE